MSHHILPATRSCRLLHGSARSSTRTWTWLTAKWDPRGLPNEVVTCCDCWISQARGTESHGERRSEFTNQMACMRSAMCVPIVALTPESHLLPKTTFAPRHLTFDSGFVWRIRTLTFVLQESGILRTPGSSHVQDLAR